MTIFILHCLFIVEKKHYHDSHSPYLQGLQLLYYIYLVIRTVVTNLERRIHISHHCLDTWETVQTILQAKQNTKKRAFTNQPTDKLFTAIPFYLFSHPLMCVCLSLSKYENDVKKFTGVAHKLHVD